MTCSDVTQPVCEAAICSPMTQPFENASSQGKDKCQERHLVGHRRVKINKLFTTHSDVAVKVNE